MHNMKYFFLFCACLGCVSLAFGQASGNVNYDYYGNSGYSGTPPGDFELNPAWSGSTPNQLIIKVEGLYNAQADKQIAIFSLVQVGKSIEEVNQLLDARIRGIQRALDSLGTETELFIDMISFVPMYEYETEKKLFSKKTYNEIPKGFELKKNLHIGFRDGNLLNDIVAICAGQEVYDLVRVAYVSDHFEAIKDSLRDHAFAAYSRILDHHQRILNRPLDERRRSINEGFNVSYPTESYRSYQAFSRARLDAGKAQVNDTRKPTTQHYVPAYFRRHEFVLHPEIIEPTIQLVYALEVRIDLSEETPEKAPEPIIKIEKERELLIVTPNGELQRIKID